MLQAIGLSKKYGGHTALDNLNLTIEPGEIFCLLGANGAGKTTTINLFLDFIRPNSGEARIDGKTVAQHASETKKITAYIPEQVSLYGNLTGAENLAYFSELAGKTLTPQVQLAFLDQAGLNREAAHKRASEYSKGMRQKVAIAAALARDARVLLLDEPTSGLDPKAAGELAQTLAVLKDKGAAVLMATHDIFRARELATRAGIMKGGKLMAEIECADISADRLETIYMEHMHD